QHRILAIDGVLRFKIVGIGRGPMPIQCRTYLLISHIALLHSARIQRPFRAMTGLIHCARRSQRAAKKITFSTRRGERVYSRKCAFHVLLISSATYTECALYLARANDGQTAGPVN